MNNYTYGEPAGAVWSGPAQAPARSCLQASDVAFDNDLSVADVQAVLGLAEEMQQHPARHRRA